MKITTYSDARDLLIIAIEGGGAADADADEFDLDAILRELRPLCDIDWDLDTIEDGIFWDVVAKHAIA